MLPITMEQRILYLDQNYASRMAKFLIGQPGHAHFGTLYHAVVQRQRTVEPGLVVPPSPFHVLETRGGYLLPTLKRLFETLSQGYWVRPWQEVVARQVARGGVHSEDLLGRKGSWEASAAAELGPLASVLSVALSGDYLARSWQAQELLALRLGVSPRRASSLPFFHLFARLLALRSLDPDRYPRDSDLIDLVMAATVGPYVDILATDRYLRELLQRVGFAGRVFSGRRPEVLRLARELEPDAESR